MNYDLRERIFIKAQDGRWNSATAEKVAKRIGLEPFATKPDVSLFNPMARPAWTLAMAGAWLSWRTREKVCESWDEYCQNWRAWRAFERSDERFEVGYELVNVSPTSLLLQGFPDMDERPPLMSGEQARKALWNALGSGQIKASAIPDKGSRPVEIPSHEWPYIVLTGTSHFADRLSFQEEMSVAAYREVTVRRDDILSIWPPLSETQVLAQPAAPASVIGPKKYSEAEQRRIYAQRRNDLGDTIPTEDQDIAYMKSFGASRDFVRKDLRSTYPKLKRGERPLKKAT